MTRRCGSKAAWALAIAALLATPFGASAHGWGHGGGRGGYHGAYRGGHHGGYYRHGGHWSGGRWIAGAIVTGAVIGLVNEATRPAPVYDDDAPVVYGQPRTVIYEDGPPVARRQVIEAPIVDDNPHHTRYIRDDGYDGP